MTENKKALELFLRSWAVPEEITEVEAYFPEAAAILSRAEQLSLGEEYVNALRAVHGRVRNDPLLLQLARAQIHLLYHSRKEGVSVSEFPDLSANWLGEEFCTYNLLLVLAGISHLEQLHKARAIPPSVTADTLSDISIWCHHQRDAKGTLGVSLGILNWMQNHIRGQLVRLGRLQFMPDKFRGPIQVYRNNQDDCLIALACDGLEFNSDGQFNGIDGVFDSSGCWTSKLEQTDIQVTGNNISAEGFAEHTTVTLPLRDWTLVLRPGTPMLDVHIPAGAPMRLEDCRASFRQALTFFPEYFPEKQFAGFMLYSWLLDIQYLELLPKTSNIVRLQKEFSLFPMNTGGHEHVERVFGERVELEKINASDLNSSLQKAVYAHLQQGGHLREGGGFILLPEGDFSRR